MSEASANKQEYPLPPLTKAPDYERLEISSTSLKRIAQCPYHYKLVKLDGLEDKPGDPAKIGSLAHKLIERQLSRKIVGASPWSLEEVHTNMGEVNAAMEHPCSDSRVDRALEYYEIFMDNMYNTLDPRAVEVTFTLPYDHWVSFTGVIDYVGKDGVVADHKTSYAGWDPMQIHDNPQHFVYLWAAKQIYEGVGNDFRYIVYALNPNPHVEEYTMTVSDEALKWHMKQYRKSVKVVFRRALPATPSAKSCRYCSFKGKQCPVPEIPIALHEFAAEHSA